MSTHEAIITELGAGWPDPGDLLQADDGGIYRIVTTTGHILTSQPGQGDYMHATVEAAEDDPAREIFRARLALTT